MRVLVFLAAVCAVAAGCSDNIPDGQLQQRGREVVDLFARTCAADGAITVVGARELDEEALSKLPAGMIEPGVQSVRLVQKDGADYYLSLAEGSCTVRTARADENTVRRQFEEWVKRGAQGANVELRADRAVQSPLPFSQLSYAWRQAGSSSETVLTANTSPSDKVPAQAVLSLTHQDYDTSRVQPLP